MLKAHVSVCRTSLILSSILIICLEQWSSLSKWGRPEGHPNCEVLVDSTQISKRREEMERLEKERQAEIRSYKGLMVSEKMTSNKQIASANKSLQELEDDFM
ncbi:hypothetical protein CK203_069275 [Vitis vinifera]|uniref:Uncharacterized protein n=1 Tax=Vitis vinifera TaxID=29760 RepID=A0A438C2A6_VITVI|nr:hypothetical protein CK203_069275 [Vitis vinifera]